MNQKELKSFFDGKFNEFKMIESRVVELSKKLEQIRTMEDDSLIQLNMGLAIFSVSKESATAILKEAIQVENEYYRIMQSRFDKAVGALS